MAQTESWGQQVGESDPSPGLWWVSRMRVWAWGGR